MYKRGLMVQIFGCSRTIKIAHGLTGLGWNMSLIQRGLKLPLWGFNTFDLIMSMGEEDCPRCWAPCLKSLTNSLDRFDVVASSNTPDNLSLFLVTESKTPVIHDCHDSMSAFRHLDIADAGKTEMLVSQRADGLLFVSEGQRDYVCDTHNVDRSKSHVYPNYYLGSYVSKYPKTKLSDLSGQMHLVYEGGMQIGGMPQSGWSAHRNIWKLFKMLLKQGIHIHIYSAVPFEPEKGQYLPINSPLLHWHKSTSLSTLMREMTQYDAGIVGFDRTYEVFIDHALPNKMFEYMGAGIPVLCDDAVAVSDWLTKYDVGEPALAKWHEGELDKITFNNIDPHIPNVEKHKDKWSVENNIDGVEKFYERVARRGR